MNKTDWAWLAGFIDGDGRFTCAVWERTPNGISSITIAPRITIAQVASNRKILDYIAEETGIGKVYIKKEKSNKFNSQDQGMYMVCKLDDIKYICEKILPYIILKKRQCRSMLKLANIRLKGKIGVNKWNRERIPIENTLKCAELGLSLTPNSISRRSGKKRTFEYWKKRIQEVYKEADEIINKRNKNKYTKLSCSICNIEFDRLKCNIKKDTKNHYCSAKCRKIGEKTIRSNK